MDDANQPAASGKKEWVEPDLELLPLTETETGGGASTYSDFSTYYS